MSDQWPPQPDPATGSTPPWPPPDTPPTQPYPAQAPPAYPPQPYPPQPYQPQGYGGYPPSGQEYPPGMYDPRKSKVLAGVLGIVIGYLGIHNFYLGYTGKAVTQLLLSTVGGIATCGLSTIAVGIWALVEGIMILTGSIATDANGVPLKN